MTAEKMTDVGEMKKETTWLFGILAAAVLLRLVLAGLTQGYGPDMSCFLAWGDHALEGLSGFYAEGYFADYTPGYIYVLAMVAAVRRLFGVEVYSGASMVLLALVPALCDAACTYLLYQTGRKHMKSRSALQRLTAFAAFCPAMVFDTAVWKQIDGAFLLPVLLCLLCLEERKYYRAALAFGIALAIKPQALLVGPVMAVAYLAAVLDAAVSRPAASSGAGAAASSKKSASTPSRAAVFTSSKAHLSSSSPSDSIGHALLRIPVGIVLALVPVLVLGLPFFGFRKLIPGLLAKYTETSASYAYASVDAFNWFAMLGGNWADQTQASVLGLSWQTLGTVNLVILTVMLFLLAYLLWKRGRFSATLLAAFYTAGIFTFSHRMHERYLLMGVAIGLLATALVDDLVLFFGAAGLSLTAFLNIASVYAVSNTDDLFLTSDTSREFLRMVGGVETVFFLILAVRIGQLAAGKAPRRIPDTQAGTGMQADAETWNRTQVQDGPKTRSITKGRTKTNSKTMGNAKAETNVKSKSDAKAKTDIKAKVNANAQVSAITADTLSGVNEVSDAKLRSSRRNRQRLAGGRPLQPSLRQRRREWIAVAILTAVAAVMGLTYLGDTSAPETTVGNYTGTVDVSFSLAQPQGAVPVEIRLYPEISWDGSFTITSDTTGDEVVNIPLTYTTIFTWQRASFASLAGEGEGTSFTAHITNGAVLEAALYDSEGNMLAVSGGGALFDEQSLVPETFSRLNSMYFDEIYHGRTAYEMAHRLTVYETTHPPLGKDLIMLAIMLFGMNAFAWRLAPAVFGVLLVPLMYLFVRKLAEDEGSRSGSNGRQRAENDDSGKLAVFAAALTVTDFMRYVESRLSTIDIFTTFFVLLSAYWMLDYAQKAQAQEHDGVRKAWLPALLSGVAFGLGVCVKWNAAYAGIGLAAVYFITLYRKWEKDVKGTGPLTAFRRDLGFTLLYGVLFFICVPFVLYLASYFPYRWRDPSFGLQDWWNCQVAMYQYHSTNTATNPFSSNWYTWPLLLRPYWYYANYELPAGIVSSVASVGNVITWTGGMVAILYLLWQQFKGTGSRKNTFLLLFYFGQLLPWILVARTTYIYHYLPISTFGIAAIAIAMQDIRSARIRRNLAIGLVAVSALLFVIFFPILSGLPVSYSYGHGLEIWKSWAFYL